MAKREKTAKKLKTEDSFAENEPQNSKIASKIAQKQQNASQDGLNIDKAIDKKFVTSILREEKKQLKQAKKLEKREKKALKKEKDAKLKQLIKSKKKEEKRIREANEATLRELEKRGKVASWFRLDNAASIYPSAANADWNFVFRVSATLKERVNEQNLQSALDDIMPGFPSFNVRLCHGFFWNYYERNFSRLKIEKEKDFPCRPFNLADDSDGFLIRVLYSDYKVILEVFHAITDARGALFFLNSLLARYFEKCGQTISSFDGCKSYLDLPSDEETEDSFQSCYTEQKFKRPKERPAYKIQGNVLPAGMVNTVEGEMSVSKLKEIAKSYGATVTEFLAAVVGYCIYKKRKSSKKNPRISVTIDLRPWFNMKTLRNFSSYQNVEVKGEELEFKDVVEIFKTDLKNIDKNMLQANINVNVRLQRNLFVKVLPLFIKNFVLKYCFNHMGENYQTLAFSNLGLVKAPEEFKDRVEGYTLNLGRSAHNEKSIGVISYGDKLNICFSSKLYETETERDVFKFLADLGLDVKVYSNRRDLYGSR